MVISLSDKPVGVVIRGGGIVIASVELLIVMVLALLLSNKFQRLTNKVTLIMEEGSENGTKFYYEPFNMSPKDDGVQINHDFIIHTH